MGPFAYDEDDGDGSGHSHNWYGEAEALKAAVAYVDKDVDDGELEAVHVEKVDLSVGARDELVKNCLW